MTDWLCADIETFSLLNHSETYKVGKAFKLVIDFCDQTCDPSCLVSKEQISEGTNKYEEINEFLQLHTINSKVIYQYFDAKIYDET